MRAAAMIVVHESSEMAIQTGFTEYDHVIQALPPNGADHPLDVSSLPGRPGRRDVNFQIKCDWRFQIKCDCIEI